MSIIETSDIVVIVGVGILFLLAVLPGEYLTNSEYNAGYDAGYTEHNISKYEAAKELTGQFINPPLTDDQISYAHGYISGYLDFHSDTKKKQNADKLNNSIKILGV